MVRYREITVRCYKAFRIWPAVKKRGKKKKTSLRKKRKKKEKKREKRKEREVISNRYNCLRQKT